MAVSWAGLGVRPVGTMTCDGDGCKATFHDGIAETDGKGLIHRRAHEAGWRIHRPNEYRADDLCPDCPGTYS